MNERPVTLSVCVDCAYFIAYGRLDDQTMIENPNAGTEHAEKVRAIWGDADITPGRMLEEGEEVDDDAETEVWFSWSECEMCGSTLGGDREYATAWVVDNN